MPVDLGGNGVDERHLSFYLRSQRLVTIRDQILEDGKLGFELRTIFRVWLFLGCRSRPSLRAANIFKAAARA